MPRKQRIEYPGAVYHVISRGNYRKELFLHQGTGEAFERSLFEAVDRCGWKLYAYVIMSNHYHLAVETPEPNLVVGMQWLQRIKKAGVKHRISTLTRLLLLMWRQVMLRKQRIEYPGAGDNVFQGRYKAILMGEDRPFLGPTPDMPLVSDERGLFVCSLHTSKRPFWGESRFFTCFSPTCFLVTGGLRIDYNPATGFN